MNLHKVTKIAAIIVAVLSLIFLGGLLATSDSDDNSWINPLIYLSYVILLACVAVVLIYVFKNLFSNKENLKKTLIAIGLFLGIVIVAFIFADSTEYNLKEVSVGSGYSKAISTALNTFYILAIASVGTLVYSSFKKFKS